MFFGIFFKVPIVRWVGQLTTSFEHISSSKFKWRVLHCILCLVDKISPRFGSLCSTGSSHYEVFVCASSLLDCTENEGESWRCIPLCSNLALCTRQCLVDTVAVSLFVFCWTQSGTDQSLIFSFSLPYMIRPLYRIITWRLAWKEWNCHCLRPVVDNYTTTKNNWVDPGEKILGQVRLLTIDFSRTRWVSWKLSIGFFLLVTLTKTRKYLQT